MLTVLRRAVAVLLTISVIGTTGCSGPGPESSETGIWFYVLVKSSNYSQNDSGELTLLNYHFFSEIFPKPGYSGTLQGRLVRRGAPNEPMNYEDRGKNYYYEGGHFETIEEADRLQPNGLFDFEIDGGEIRVRSTMKLGDANGETDIPAPITITLLQGGEPVSPAAVDPGESLLIRWSEYSNGAPDENGIVDDMIFVVLQNCQGERIVHTGLPFENDDYMTYRSRELTVDAGTLRPGEPYAMFVEFPHVVDSSIVSGVPGFTSFATATYLDIQTRGEADIDSACLTEMPAMDTGQTDRPAQ